MLVRTLFRWKKNEINSGRTVYTRPFPFSVPLCIPSRVLVLGGASWVAARRVVRVVDERNCPKWKSTLVDASMRSRDLTWRVKQNAKHYW